MPASDNLKMKDLEARTGLTRQAIHFYLREGLLPEPERPKRNVAHYSEEHVDRIKLIKRLQEEKFLPLGVIKNMLSDADTHVEDSRGGLAAFQLTTLALLDGDVPTGERTIADVSSHAEIEEAEIEALDKSGVIRLHHQEGERFLDYRDADYRDATIVELWARLLNLGFRDRPGYDDSYLEKFARVLAPLAELEVENFLESFSDSPTETTAELAVQGIEITNEIFIRLRTQALLRALDARINVGDDRD
jgi:DNA-binding transcriptional MerR regulator